MRKLFLTLLFTPLFLTAQTEEEAVTVIQEVEKNTSEEVVSTLEETEKQENKVINEECISGNCKNGTGTMQYQTGVYVGTWENGLRNGHGKYTWTNGDKYEGVWQDDNRHGFGVYVWNDGSKYKGNYSHGIRSGYGIYYYTNGNIYEGTWQNNLKHGIANLYFKESVNIGGKYINNEYVSGTGINQESYNYKPAR
ncbi:MAG TPA: hypothetical protein DDZ39_06570 [Flavobacteriaceae bacterium]|nr:hypothetical protein [Flavobacteriaceae bacterium]